MIKLFVFLLFAVLISSCKENGEYPKNKNGELTWLTMDQVSTIKNADGKYFFVDLYTDWCGWCKRMDKTTFVDPAVVKLMDDKFHSVKFDAEQKEPINFNGKTYNWQPGGRKGVNQLAVELLNGRLSYPSFVVLDKNLNVKKTIIGYKKPEQLLSELQNL